MISDDAQKILTNVIQGSIVEGQADNLTTARNFLCRSFSTSTKVEKNFELQSAIKKEQEDCLNVFIGQHPLWLNSFPDREKYLTQGGEATIYLDTDNRTVVKLNDAVYYNTWLDFLNSVLIHNLIFEDTAYTLHGFCRKNDRLYAVLKQPFVISDSPTDLDDVRYYLQFNGFLNVRRNDYYNKELGLILEDIHDENVLVKSNKFFFIDTVFFINLP